jgi:formamidopyrimidine-DNA glycosylase
MPELPEVEIVRKSLSKNIKGKVITKVEVNNRNLRVKIEKKFEEKLKKKKIKKIDRFSKYIIIVFFDNSFCLIHLGMSGTIHLLKKKNKNKFTNTSFYHSPHLPKKHNHVEIELQNITLIYNDPRRFGYLLYFDNKKQLQKKFKYYGPEPFSKKFNLEYILKYFQNKNKNIKNFLLDQKFVSGLGNIYASEVLFESKIYPLKSASLLTNNQLKKIIKYSKKVLKRSIAKGGSSIRDFKNTTGDQGSFQKEFKVYNREHLKCTRRSCGGIIKKIIISNRSSFFCNICQK